MQPALTSAVEVAGHDVTSELARPTLTEAVQRGYPG